MRFLVTAHEFDIQMGARIRETFEFRAAFDPEEPHVDREVVERLRHAYLAGLPVVITVGELAASALERPNA